MPLLIFILCRTPREHWYIVVHVSLFKIAHSREIDKAIAGSTDYDDALAKLLAGNPYADARTLFKRLEIEDIQMTADVLRPVYDQSEPEDRFVSVEVMRYWRATRRAASQKHAGRVSDSGEKRWTIAAAFEESVSAPVLSAELYERFSSRGEGDSPAGYCPPFVASRGP